MHTAQCLNFLKDNTFIFEPTPSSTLNILLQHVNDQFQQPLPRKFRTKCTLRGTSNLLSSVTYKSQSDNVTKKKHNSELTAQYLLKILFYYQNSIYSLKNLLITANENPFLQMQYLLGITPLSQTNCSKHVQHCSCASDCFYCDFYCTFHVTCTLQYTTVGEHSLL